MSATTQSLLLSPAVATPERTTARASNLSPGVGPHYAELKRRMHEMVLERVELEKLARLTELQVKTELALLIDRVVGEQNVLVNEAERRQLGSDIYDEMFGLGPLEPLLRDATISDILVNTHRRTFVERFGRLEATDITFYDDAHLMKIIEKIVSRVGRRIDESSPMVDARLPDGSRVNAIIPPSAIDGPLLSIRRFGSTPLQMADILRLGTLIEPMAQVLTALVAAKVNILVSGGTGSGKTTLLNILSASIPDTERVVTIEDAAELQLDQQHVLRLETRPPNIEGKGEITQRTLVRNALRMRPDRIILGEVRGAEALDMLNAMNTGHEGSLATVHANSPRDALTRLENMVSMSGVPLPSRAMRQQIASAITVIVQTARLTDGRRRLTSLQEITGMEGEIITMQELFTFKRTGVERDGTVRGYFCASGVRPRFAERLQTYGMALPDAIYDPSRRYEV
ncbi:type II secretion system protein E [Pandoraea communis]|uniref:Type II secretion system protein E n=1 Tax=Pandoraea communis TaxID=2508297 RepID=A0A5E4REQ7_9BURK|nr:CpaF family protein [Pandoraea communis]VVD61313.1 type II secretion system protein E [Pandoraea communis]